MRGELDYTVAVKHGGNSSRILGALLIVALGVVSIRTFWGSEHVDGQVPEQVVSVKETETEALATVEPDSHPGLEIADPGPSSQDFDLQETSGSGSDASELNDADTNLTPVDEALELADAAPNQQPLAAPGATVAPDEFEALGLGDRVMPAKAPEVDGTSTAEASSAKNPAISSLPNEAIQQVGDPVNPREATPVGGSNSLATPDRAESNQALKEAPIVLLEPATLAGRLLVDPGVPLGILRVELEELLPIHGGKGRLLDAVVPDDQGVFTIQGVQPGLVALRISLWGTNRALVWVDEIELGEAELRLDPSACEVSLLGRLQSREVEVLDEFGLRIEPAVCFPVESRDHSFGTPRVQSKDVTPRIWMERSGVDLLVLAPDREPRRVSLGPDSSDTGAPLAVALQRLTVRSLELRFLDRGLLEGLPPGFRLQAKLLRTNGLTFPWDGQRHRGEFDDKGKLRLEPADCGQFEVHLSLVSPSGGERPLNRLPELVEVLPAGGLQHIGSSETDAVQVVHLRGFSGALGVTK